MFFNNWKNNTEKIVDVILLPVEHNLNRGFVAEYISSMVIRDPELCNMKHRHHVVRRLDNNQIITLHPIWHGLVFRNGSNESVFHGLELTDRTLLTLFYKQHETKNK
jgi:hypothetical protein